MSAIEKGLPMSQLRDFQRSKVYSAETKHSKFKWKSHGNKLQKLSETKRYVADITTSKWWKSHGGFMQVQVYDGRGRTRACGTLSYVKLPKWSRTELVILHELAHALTGQQYERDRIKRAGHGCTFTKNYLDLIKRYLGHDDWLEMKELFREHKVRTRSSKDKWQ